MSKTLLPIIFAISIACCRTEDTSMLESSNRVAFNVLGLVDTIRSYTKANVKDVGLVTIEVKRSLDTTIFFIASIRSLEEIPSFYFITDGKPVLIYTGLEPTVDFDYAYVSHIKSSTKNFLEEFELATDKDGRIQNLPPTSVPVIWKVEVVANQIVSMRIYG